ncbi:DNA-processing protein DprA [Naasia aerilata]|nr:DNA-processing protein DprA [Naasia aerilata]
MEDAAVTRESLALIALLRRSKRWSELKLRLEEHQPSDLLAGELGGGLFTEDVVNQAIEEARHEVATWAARGIAVATPYGGHYPAQLKPVHDYPLMLFSRGVYDDRDERSVAVVGTRKPSDGALQFIREVVPALVEKGHVVVSGLARGVDTAAMQASLDAGGRTVGIIGTGILHSYPAENRSLQERIASDHLLLSQFWPDAPPTKSSFPMRNHVMSAFSSMTLIVEASEHSGTRIQARAATQHARPLIITRAVYLQTVWGRELVERGLDVTVVSSAREAVAAVESIARRATVAEQRRLVTSGA